jgi:tRNA U38,U39,U40 pseudouridine synthase TruA
MRAALLLCCCVCLHLQVVQFMTDVTSIDPQKLPYKLNSLLPRDIRVTWMSQTAPDFNVTVSALHKV